MTEEVGRGQLLSFRKLQPNQGNKRKYQSLKAPILKPIEQPAVDIQSTKLEKNEKFYNPVVDSEVPPCVSMSCSCIGKKRDFIVENLPPLPSIEEPSFFLLFESKINQCSEEVSPADVQGFSFKGKVLREFLALFDNDLDVAQLTDDQLHKVFKMIYKNLFKRTPIIPTALQTLDYSTPVIEPEWCNNFYSYQILHKFMNMFSNRREINLHFIKRAINLLILPDPNERIHLGTVIRKYYETKEAERGKVLKLLESQLQYALSNVYPPYAVQPIIMFINYVSKRKIIPAVNLQNFIYTYFIPLLGNRYSSMFMVSMQTFLIDYCENDPKETSLIIKSALKRFSVTNGTKQVQLLTLVIQLAQRLPETDFRLLSPNLYRFLSFCIKTSNFALQEAVLDVWLDKKSVPLMMADTQHSVSALAAPVIAMTGPNANIRTLKKARAVMAVMSKLEREIIIAAKSPCGALTRSDRNARRKEAVWMQIARMGAEKTGDADGLIDSLAKIKAEFGARSLTVDLGKSVTGPCMAFARSATANIFTSVQSIRQSPQRHLIVPKIGC